MIRKSFAKVAVVVASLWFATSVSAQPGSLLATVTVPVASSSCCGIGIDYDGTHILYTNYLDSTVYKTDLTGANLGSVPLINPDGSPFSGGLNAIAYNFSDGMLYGGAWDGTTNLYKTDLATGITTLVKANAVPVAFGFIDGLAWDPTDNTFWMSDDVQCNVRHLDVLGNDIGGFDGCAVTGLANSGLAVSLNGLLWYGTNGAGLIHALDTSTSPPTDLGLFASPGGRDEDMVCGPEYTKADGSSVETLLSKDAYNNTFAVIEVAKGECTSPAEPKPVKGRMTGGGSVGKTDVRHGFELHCDMSLPNNLEINWGKGNNFHLTSLTLATCSDDPSIDEGQPVAGFDTYAGSGVGKLNGVDGATIDFVLTDAGEPGKAGDYAKFSINGGAALAVSGTLDSGNHQAHPE